MSPVSRHLSPDNRGRRLIADALGCVLPLTHILGRLKPSRPSHRNPKHLSWLSSPLSALAVKEVVTLARYALQTTCGAKKISASAKQPSASTVYCDHLPSCSRRAIVVVVPYQRSLLKQHLYSTPCIFSNCFHLHPRSQGSAKG